MIETIRRWLHDHLDYAYPDPSGPYLGDSFQATFPCRMCSRVALLDSQGNWFHGGERGNR